MLAILLIGLCRLLGRNLWLPRRIAQRLLPADKLRAGLNQGARWLQRLERVSRPHRLSWLASPGPADIVNNGALILGAVLMLDPTRPWRWMVPVALTVVYLFFMHNRVRREERKLAPLFGADYQRYLLAVPRFVPARRPFPEGRTRYWNPAAFRRNHGARNLAAVLAGHAFAYFAVYHLLPRWMGG